MYTDDHILYFIHSDKKHKIIDINKNGSEDAFKAGLSWELSMIEQLF